MAWVEPCAHMDGKHERQRWLIRALSSAALHWGMDFQGGEGEAANGSWDFVGRVPVSPGSWVWEGHGDS